MDTQARAYIYDLDECLDWIRANNFSRIVLQFKNEDLKHSVAVVDQLLAAYQQHEDQSNTCNIDDRKPLDLYVTQSNTCCVDLIVNQHVSNVDAIIHFGNVCLSKPHIENDETQKPILFAFNFLREEDEISDKTIDELIEKINTIQEDTSNRPTYILYDTSLITYARRLQDKLTQSANNKFFEVAKLCQPSPRWSSTRTNQIMFSNEVPETNKIGHFGLSKPIDYYKSAIFLGNRLSINIILHGPARQWHMKFPDSRDLEQVNVTRTLNRRMALVHRLRDEEELKVGVILTNPLPNITAIMDTLGAYARARKHTLYFISMIQTIDECKVGNFDLCDAFVVINSCTCSTILESLVFNRPIMNNIEFKLACGFEGEYGRVLWPGSDSHLSTDDLLNKRRVSDVSLALIHTRNEMLERCSQARVNKWSGMDYKATVSSGEGIYDGSGGGGVESLTIEEGLHGIASTYKSEPLQKSDKDNQSCVVNSDKNVTNSGASNINDTNSER